jgi:flavin reductase (DIM6/NTAB) family NADH-FMN oxidoreductase RutF
MSAGHTDRTAPPPEQTALRDVLGRFATGVTVVSTGGAVPQGMTANSFTSVSLEPPLVLVCVNRRSAIHRTVLENKTFTISVLSADQEHLARYFADHSRPRGENEFSNVGWSPGPSTGAPILHGALCWLECSLAAAHDGGDHSIITGTVLASGSRADCEALIFYRGGFHGRQPRPAQRQPHPGEPKAVPQ